MEAIGDILLIWDVDRDNDELMFARIGSHSEILDRKKPE